MTIIISQFNLYLERVQENRNYQDLEVYDESIKKVIKNATAIVLLAAASFGTFKGAQTHALNKAQRYGSVQTSADLGKAGQDSYDMEKKGATIKKEDKKNIENIIVQYAGKGKAVSEADIKYIFDILNLRNANEATKTAVMTFLDQVPFATGKDGKPTMMGISKELFKNLKKAGLNVPRDFDYEDFNFMNKTSGRIIDQNY